MRGTAGPRFESVFSTKSRLLACRPEGIFISEFEQGEIGPDKAP
jgi:hypothetical protein